jgi:two-component system chemotaxis sensor kinase CheA
MPRGARLTRQLAQALGATAEAELLARAPDRTGWSALLDAVDATYARQELAAEVARRALEWSARELRESNRSLSALNRAMQAMMDSLGQGFLSFGSDGRCARTFSRACLSLLECAPGDRPLAEVLRIPAEQREDFDGWVGLLFESELDFDDLAELGPRAFPHSEGRVVTLEFRPVREEDGRLGSVVLVATDRTREVEAARRLEEKTAYVELVTRTVANRGPVAAFLRSVRGFLAQGRRALATSPGSLGGAALAEFQRQAHTFKGAAGMLGLAGMRQACGRFEDAVAATPDPASARAAGARLVEELGAETDRFLAELGPLLGGAASHPAAERDLLAFHARLAATPGAEELRREYVEQVLSSPLEELVGEHAGAVAEAAAIVGKRMRPLRIEGGGVRLLREPFDAWLRTLVHLFRNAVDHGIEHPAERLAGGKPEAGGIEVRGERFLKDGRPWARVRVSDDGRGVDPARIRERLRGMGADAGTLAEPDERIVDHVFDAGFSTRARAGEISGRGMGLDAVKVETERLGGVVRLRSWPGRGTEFEFELPLAITPGELGAGTETPPSRAA